MIISKTPFRISFSGGSTDFKEFYQHESGCVISTTIDKYIYLSMHPLFNNNGYHLKYFKNELVDSIDKIQHPIIKEVFKRYNISGVDFNSSSDVPSGTGLGSSSSFTVGLINLCRHYKNTKDYKVIGSEACNIEIDILKAPIGKQDQYAATIGGLKFYEFLPDESVLMSHITISEQKLKELEDSLILFYLGGQREACSVLSEQKKGIAANMPILRKMVKLTENLRNELNNNSIDNFGKILHEGWMYKKELSGNVSNGAVNFWYEKGLESGAEGGKLLGGGSTGFMLFFGDTKQLRANMRLLELPFKFENTGTQIIYQ
jgi:D-glycero-alpha-D-manno-heptose-7-phosphate kinase